MNMKNSHGISRLGALLVLLLLVGLGGAGVGCAHSPTDQSVKDQADLELTVTTFHRDMRWRRWEAAAASVAPERRRQFLARYRELGDDFHISNLEIKTLDRVGSEVIVDLEEESYTEPAMIVKKKRYIEVWEKPDNAWLLTRRMLKDEYLKMKKQQHLDAKAPPTSPAPGDAAPQDDELDAPDEDWDAEDME